MRKFKLLLEIYKYLLLIVLLFWLIQISVTHENRIQKLETKTIETTGSLS